MSDNEKFIPGESEYTPNSEWELIQTTGVNKPPPMSHHSSVEYKGKMYLFGGSNLSAENANMYSLDLHRYQWNLLKPIGINNDSGNIPYTRDEHSCVVHNDTMIIFGGFEYGERTNSIYRYHFKMNQWEKVEAKSKQVPCARAGHSAVIRYHDKQGDHMYIFGGKDDENCKLSDTWKFNLDTFEWTQIYTATEPLGRSGHAS
jgi:N-acetylneuraminic acid mutarotase